MCTTKKILFHALGVFILTCLIASLAHAEEEITGSGADASNPTAAVNFQDIRYRYFDLLNGADKHSFETEGSYMFNPRKLPTICAMLRLTVAARQKKILRNLNSRPFSSPMGCHWELRQNMLWG